MLIEQLSIFIENREGRLAEVTKILKDADINIWALSLADTTDFGVLRLIIDKDKAEKVLKQEGFTVGKTNVIAVRLDNSLGDLNRILNLIHEQSINLEYLYSLADTRQGKPVMIFRFDDNDKAIKTLAQNSIKIIRNLETDI